MEGTALPRCFAPPSAAVVAVVGGGWGGVSPPAAPGAGLGRAASQEVEERQDAERRASFHRFPKIDGGGAGGLAGGIPLTPGNALLIAYIKPCAQTSPQGGGWWWWWCFALHESLRSWCGVFCSSLRPPPALSAAAAGICGRRVSFGSFRCSDLARGGLCLLLFFLLFSPPPPPPLSTPPGTARGGRRVFIAPPHPRRGEEPPANASRTLRASAVTGPVGARSYPTWCRRKGRPRRGALLGKGGGRKGAVREPHRVEPTVWVPKRSQKR